MLPRVVTSTYKTEVTAFRGKEPIRAKAVVDNKVLEHV
jgi:hypothetical protein